MILEASELLLIIKKRRYVLLVFVFRSVSSKIYTKLSGEAINQTPKQP